MKNLILLTDVTVITILNEIGTIKPFLENYGSVYMSGDRFFNQKSVNFLANQQLTRHQQKKLTDLQYQNLSDFQYTGKDHQRSKTR